MSSEGGLERQGKRRAAPLAEPKGARRTNDAAGMPCSLAHASVGSRFRLLIIAHLQTIEASPCSIELPSGTELHNLKRP